MELFETRTSHYDLLEWSDDFPNPKERGLILPDASINASLTGGFGKMSFQGLRSDDGFALWYNKYGLSRTTTFFTEALNAAIEINVMLTNSADHILFNRIHQSISAQQYNFFYLPYIKNEIVLYKDQYYDTLDYHFDLPYFEKLLNHYPNIIGPMLDKAYKGEGVSFLPAASFMNEDLRQLNRHVIRIITRKINDLYYLNIAVKLFLIAALLNCSGSPDKDHMILSQEEEANLVLAHEKLMDDLSQFTSITELSRIAKMNSTKFKSLYKTKFSLSPRKYWNEFRMDKALEQVLYSNESITDISNSLGFSSLSAFTRAYIFKYQMTPVEMRRRAR